MDVSALSRSGSLSKYWSSKRCNPRGLYLGPFKAMKFRLVCPNGPLCGHTPPSQFSYLTLLKEKNGYSEQGRDMKTVLCVHFCKCLAKRSLSKS